MPSLDAVPDMVDTSKRIREYLDEDQICDFKSFRKQPNISKAMPQFPVQHVAKHRKNTKRKATCAPPRGNKIKATSDYGWRGEAEIPRVFASLPPSLINRFSSLSNGRPPDR